MPRSRGNIELLLVLPLLVLLAWGGAYTALQSHQSGRLERAAWVYSMSKGADAEDSEAEKRAKSLFGSESKGHEVMFDSDRSWVDSGLEAFFASKSDIPYAFRAGLLLSLTERKSVSVDSKLSSPSLLSFLGENGVDSPATHWREDALRFSSEATRADEAHPYFHKIAHVEIPGSDFAESFLLKQALFVEAMRATDFGYPLLQIIGVPELVYIATGTDYTGGSDSSSETSGGDLSEVDTGIFGGDVTDLSSEVGGAAGVDPAALANYSPESVTSAAGSYAGDWMEAQTATGVSLPTSTGEMGKEIEARLEKKLEEKVYETFTKWIREGLDKAGITVTDATDLEHFEKGD